MSAATHLPSAELLGALALARSSVASALRQHALAVCPLMLQMLHTGRCERRGSLLAALCVATKAAAVAVLVAALLDCARCRSSRCCSESTCVMASPYASWSKVLFCSCVSRFLAWKLRKGIFRRATVEWCTW